MLTNLDRAALAAYCGAYALWAEATEAIQKYGTMVKSPTGFPIQSPYVSIANRQAEIMMRIASEFGFTPASRSRISAPAEPERSLFDVFEEDDEEAEPAVSETSDSLERTQGYRAKCEEERTLGNRAATAAAARAGGGLDLERGGEKVN